MSPFIAQGVQKGAAVTFNLGNLPAAVEIAAGPGLPQHGGCFVLTGSLTTESEISKAIERLIAALKATGAEAKRMLEGRQSSND